MPDETNNPNECEFKEECCSGGACDCMSGVCSNDCRCTDAQGSAAPAKSGIQNKDEPQASAPADELAAAKAQAAEYLDGWKRAMADYANLKKESEREKAEMAKFAAAILVREILPALDSLKQASAENPFASVGGETPDAAKVMAWAAGVGNVAAQLQAALKKAGVEAIEEPGAPFDPHIHEAVTTRKEEGKASGLVLEVLQPGYRMSDRIIRAAKVVVSE
ncbi:MAG: nucleotide exchange factor GrpE [Patescibacteria group bacterium]|nr:nucleotide exchange factor GrpE [Patescibacteria group bacterium]